MGLWNYFIPELALEVGWLLATVMLLVQSGTVGQVARTRIRRLGLGLAIVG